MLTLLWCIEFEPCFVYLCIWAHFPSIIAPWSWSLSLTYRENKREWKTERQRKNIYTHTTYTGSEKETGQNNADPQTHSRTHTEDKEGVSCAQLLSQGMRRSQVQVWVLKPLCKIKLTDIKLKEQQQHLQENFNIISRQEEEVQATLSRVGKDVNNLQTPTLQLQGSWTTWSACRVYGHQDICVCLRGQSGGNKKQLSDKWID